MTLEQFVQWILATVTTVDLHDGRPQVTDSNYAYISTDGPVGSRDSIATGDSRTLTVHIVCVGIDPTGARWVARQVADALAFARPDGNHPLTWLPAGPELVDGTPTTGGERTSITLTFQLLTRRTA